MPSFTLHITRPTNDLAALTAFYTTALDLKVLFSLENHSGFDGVMLGHPDCSWHLESTYQHDVVLGRAPTKEHLLIFYVKEKGEWERAVKKVEDAGGVKVESENPYWDSHGATFEDPDGYRVVIQKAAWPLELCITDRKYEIPQSDIYLARPSYFQGKRQFHRPAVYFYLCSKYQVSSKCSTSGRSNCRALKVAPRATLTS